MALKISTAKAGSKIAPKASKTPPKAKAATKAASASAAKGKTMTAAKPKAAIVVTTKHLAASIADQHDLPQKQANLLLTNLVDLMVDHLKKGDRLRINGLGILEVKSRAARTGRNPATGEIIQIKASKKIAFRAAKELKEAV
jgi:DNA-binding protein HU-beta